MKFLKSLEERDWGKIDNAQADQQFADYRKHLELLKPRLSAKAWKHFWFGFAEKSIHDANLIGLCVGDGLKRLPKPLQYDPVTIRADFLNQNAEYRFTFTYRKIKRFTFQFDATLGQYLVDLSSSEYFHDPGAFMVRNRLDGVLGEELTAADDEYLSHEMIFSSGARILIEAAKISFEQQKISRK